MVIKVLEQCRAWLKQGSRYDAFPAVCVEKMSAVVVVIIIIIIKDPPLEFPMLNVSLSCIP
jgi:hypothetical protein